MQVGTVQIVVAFEESNLFTYSLGPRIEELESRLNAQMIPFNVPEDAPSQIPRLAIKTADVTMNITKERFQLFISPPDQVKEDFDASADFCNQRFEAIFEIVKKGMPDYLWAGVIFQYSYPDPDLYGKGMHRASEALFDNLLTVERDNRTLSDFSIKLGFKEENLNIIYQIKSYEHRFLPTNMHPPSVRQSKTIDGSTLPIGETGREIEIDVNNKPATRHSTVEVEVDTILKKHSSLYTSIGNELNLNGVLE